ncbi:MAG TPA: succinyl-diaminopimelate desuccinylase [Roseiarcus sp.]|jgi:succinyl-diaminopimelate desuccinylase|nr:succinyl-diaminopimelate desuccinylase [Roseiarcus sp.]
MAAPPSALDIARALIAFPSVTPADAGALPYLRDLLAGAGFSAELATFSEAGTPNVLNLYARLGTAAPNLVFAGHTDVVPPGDASRWRFPPFATEVVEGLLWGRGACDMKGGLAAAVAAALRFIARAAFQGSISFLVTGDEEGPAINGTVKLVRWALARGERFDHCIVGEPTSVERLGDTIKHGRRGSLTGRLALAGRQGHVAYPHLADNPIRALAPVLSALFDPPLDGGDADFEPSNLEVVSIDVGNPAANVIPDEVRLTFNVRFNDLWTPDTLEAEIGRRVVRGTGGRPYGLAFDPTNAIAFLTPRGAFTDLVAGAVEDVTGRRPALSTGGGTSDARFIKDACPVVELGLVNATIHAVDERVALNDLEGLTRIYERVMERYFAAPPDNTRRAKQ